MKVIMVDFYVEVGRFIMNCDMMMFIIDLQALDIWYMVGWKGGNNLNIIRN
jgi:hypothetical protein